MSNWSSVTYLHQPISCEAVWRLTYNSVALNLTCSSAV